jgi:hypothetical protein
VAAATGTGRALICWFGRIAWFHWRWHCQQFAGAGDTGFTRVAGEQAVMADTVESPGQDVKQEAADELVGFERHDLLTV